MKDKTFHVNSNSGLSLDSLEESGWGGKLMSARGEVQYSVVRDAVEDEHIDIVGTIAFRKHIEETLGVSKRHANRIAPVSEPWVKRLHGQPVSCVTSVDAWSENYKKTAMQNRTANLHKPKSSS